jgi:hypothetical protein
MAGGAELWSALDARTERALGEALQVVRLDTASLRTRDKSGRRAIDEPAAQVRCLGSITILHDTKVLMRRIITSRIWRRIRMGIAG